MFSDKSSDHFSQELLHAVVDSAIGFAIFVMDPNGTVLAWNKGAEHMLGYREEEMVGHDADVIFTPEDRARGQPDRERQEAVANGRAEDDRWHVRRDGSRLFGSGLLMPLRGATGFVKILRDRTEQHHAEQSVRQSEARFRLLATSIPQLVFRTLGTGERTWGSPQWEVYAGLTDSESRGVGWLEAVHPDDRERTMAAWQEALRTGKYRIEHRIRRVADGEYRWHLTEAHPPKGGDPATAEWVGTSTDVHELRGLQDRQRMLLAELQHRSRNLLAVVQAMARQTARRSESLDDFQEQFQGRLRTLSEVQSLLAQANFATVDLRDVVQTELFSRGDFGPRVEVAGPSVDLDADAAQALALALHELTTNAVKYGALAQPGGRLGVRWRVDRRADGGWIAVKWQESGVQMPRSGRPPRRGYGSELIERALPYQLGARTELLFGEDGVTCLIEVPWRPPPQEVVS